MSEDLTHHGIRGMHWGVRKESSSGDSQSGMSTKKKVAIGVGVGAAVLGAAAAATILSRNGKISSSSISSSFGTAKKFTTTNKYGTSEYGSHAVKAFEKSLWNQNVKSLSDDIREATRLQDIRVKQSINNLPGSRIVDADLRKKFGLPPL